LKLEYCNPSFSVKDRTALGLVQAAMAAGRLGPGGTLIESTSGNLGKSLAMLGAVYGFRVIVVVDSKTSPSIINWCEAYGAVIDRVTKPDEDGGFQKARVARVRSLLAQYPDAFWPNQYDNEANPAFHFETTGEEIADLATKVHADTVVGSVSTGGHLCGVSRKVRAKRPRTKVIACDVSGSAVFGGSYRPYLLNGVGLSWRSRNTDLALLTRICIASDQEAISVCRLLARSSGLLLGGSGGLVVYGALACLKQTSARCAVAIVPDTGANYFDNIYNNEWLQQNGIPLLSRDQLADHLNRTSLLHPEELPRRQNVEPCVSSAGWGGPAA
jgi:cystathionine beta-synthase/cysteine synthase A